VQYLFLFQEAMSTSQFLDDIRHSWPPIIEKLSCRKT
jgi:hypothetical protein